MVSATVSVITRFMMGKMTDRKGVGVYMGIGMVLVMCCTLLLSFAKGPLMFFGAALFSGAAIGTLMQMAVIMAMNVVVPNRRGAANATIYTALDLGLGAGAISFGKIAAISSMSTMYLCAAILMLLPLIFYFSYEKKHYNRQIKAIQSQL